jgi:tRNA(fMet)-specific endonuclease VapC
VKFLMDTDHLSILQKQAGLEYVNLSNRLAQQAPNDVVLSVVSYHEQVLGCQTYLSRARSSADLTSGYDRLWRVHTDFTAMTVLPFDAAAAAVFDGLAAQRVRIGSMDLRIAAIAQSRGLIVLTRNLRDFGKVPGLVSADWTV